jgi:hypothetical protein
VDENRFFKDMENQEAGNQSDHRFNRLEVEDFYLFNDFRKNFKTYDSKQDSRSKSHNQMEFILKPQGE